MNVRELRIGSILQGKNGYRTVKELHKDHFIDEEGLSTLYRDAKPVILSESLLIDSGFWHIEFRDKWQLDGFGFQLEDPERADKSDGYGLLYGLVGHEFQRIKYLHQLQNLYFALTGKELSIKK